jgi:hypothetical protein
VGVAWQRGLDAYAVKSSAGYTPRWKLGPVSPCLLRKVSVTYSMVLMEYSNWMVSVRRRHWAGGLTNSLTTLAEPLRASLWTLEESAFVDFAFDNVLGADMSKTVFSAARWVVALFTGLLTGNCDVRSVEGTELSSIGVKYL